MKRLYDFQSDLCRRIIGEWRAGRRSVCAVLPTGGGKTVCAGALMERLIPKGRRILILVHRRELIRQFLETLSEMGFLVDVGVIASGHPSRPWAQIQLASVQALNMRKHLDLAPDYIVIDEAHHARAKTWTQILERWPNARRLGMTATPRRMDGKGLGEHFDALVVGPDTQDLIERGYLAPFRMIAPPVETLNTRGIRILAGDYSKKDMDEKFTDDTIADCTSAYMEHVKGRRAIIFCWSVHRSEELAGKLKNLGVRCEHIDGNTDVVRRDNVLASFARGEVEAITNVDIISEGFDCPGADAIVMMRPTQSLTIYLQQIGRGLRYQPGKTALLVDLARNVYAHGFPTQRRVWGLHDAGARRGSRADRAAKRGYQIRTCADRNCLTLIPTDTDICPACGRKWVPSAAFRYKEEKMKLEEINKQQAAEGRDVVRKGKRHKQALRRILGLIQTHGDYRELEEAAVNVAKEYGYKRGWAIHAIGVMGKYKKPKQGGHHEVV